MKLPRVAGKVDKLHSPKPYIDVASAECGYCPVMLGYPTGYIDGKLYLPSTSELSKWIIRHHPDLDRYDSEALYTVYSSLSRHAIQHFENTPYNLVIHAEELGSTSPHTFSILEDIRITHDKYLRKLLASAIRNIALEAYRRGIRSVGGRRYIGFLLAAAHHMDPAEDQEVEDTVEGDKYVSLGWRRYWDVIENHRDGITIEEYKNLLTKLDRYFRQGLRDPGYKLLLRRLDTEYRVFSGVNMDKGKYLDEETRLEGFGEATPLNIDVLDEIALRSAKLYDYPPMKWRELAKLLIDKYRYKSRLRRRMLRRRDRKTESYTNNLSRILRRRLMHGLNRRGIARYSYYGGYIDPLKHYLLPYTGDMKIFRVKGVRRPSGTVYLLIDNTFSTRRDDINRYIALASSTLSKTLADMGFNVVPVIYSDKTYVDESLSWRHLARLGRSKGHLEPPVLAPLLHQTKANVSGAKPIYILHITDRSWRGTKTEKEYEILRKAGVKTAEIVVSSRDRKADIQVTGDLDRDLRRSITRIESKIRGILA